MIFVYKKWEEFCKKLHNNNMHSIPACDVTSNLKDYLVLKHDVETDVFRAYKIAEIEHRFGHRGSYYIQAYLLDDTRNVEMLSKMLEMGHEISYHYDVLDSSKGDLDKAIIEFENNLKLFESKGFNFCTVCQHGNPIIERNGYNSNRDFFRSQKVQELYPDVSDIMVNFKEKVPTDYLYFSDAGRVFKLIFDPINNDIINSDDENISYKDLDALFEDIDEEKGNIISIHPHRWTQSVMVYFAKTFVFKTLKFVTKILVKIPMFNKLMSKYYYLAKKA